MRFSRQGYWSGLPFPSPGDLPNPGIEPGSPVLQADSLLTEPPGKPILFYWFSSVAQSCPTLCNPMDCSTPSFPVYHQPLELAQTHVYQVCDAIQPSHPLSSPSPPAFNLAQQQGLSHHFTFIKKLFSSSLVSAIRVVSSPYPRLLIFLPRN